MSHHPRERVFATRPAKPDGVHVVAALYIKCGHPGCRESIDFLSTGRGKTNPDHARKVWGRKGWEIGRNADSDRCPQHTRLALRAERETDMGKETPINHASHEKSFDGQLRAAAAVAPIIDAKAARMPGRDDNQLILIAVQEAYPAPGEGYTAGVTDDSIAAELGLPRVWIAQVREQFFGPAVVVDPRVAGLEARYAQLLATQRKIVDEVATFTADLQTFRLDLNQLKKGA